MKIFKQKLDDLQMGKRHRTRDIRRYRCIRRSQTNRIESSEWRQAYGRQIFGLKYEDNIEGIVCVAYTNDISQSVRELNLQSEMLI